MTCDFEQQYKLLQDDLAYDDNIPAHLNSLQNNQQFSMFEKVTFWKDQPVMSKLKIAIVLHGTPAQGGL